MTDLTKDEAFRFLETILKIDNPSVTFNQMTKLQVLNLIIRSWHKFVPFQNVTQLCLTQREHRLPTVQEIIDHQMAGRGGVCMHQNIFCKLVLSALGYKTHFVAAEFKFQFDHVIVVVEDVVESGDLYLADVGSGYVTTEAIPLDFSKQREYVYSSGGLEYKYTKKNSEIIRFHRKVSEKRSPLESDVHKWWRYYTFELEYRDLAFLYSDEADFKYILTNVQSSTWFLNEVRAVKFTENGSIAIKNNILLQKRSDGQNKKELDDTVKLVEAFEEFFPMLDESSVLEGFNCANSNARRLLNE